VIPALGKAITGDRESYQYLVESIRVHPAQEELKALMLEAGFDEVRYHNLSGGIVAVHVGYKY
jgi:demethylmenaquinone methyltransferase/2-methoxy-6-polyprenyl-1,4-benzoquinol methylase